MCLTRKVLIGFNKRRSEMYKVELFETANNQLAIRLRFNNGKIFMTTETYKHKRHAFAKAKELAKNLGKSAIELAYISPYGKEIL